MYRIRLLVTLLLLAVAPSLRAQAQEFHPVELSGPRVGVTALFGPVADSLHDALDINPVISQFGWQMEHRFYTGTGTDKISGVTELVVLVGGLDQGAFIPSASWLVGARTARGTEFGVGPNLSAAGVGMVVAGGITFRTGELNFPVNLAVVPARNGTRISLLSGFNIDRASTRGGLWGW